METLERRKTALRIQERVKFLKKRVEKEKKEGVMSHYYSTIALANVLGVTEQSIWNWRTSGLIKARKVANRVFEYDLHQIIEDLEKVT